MSLAVFVGCTLFVLWPFSNALDVFVGNDTAKRVTVQMKSRNIESLDKRLEIVNRVGYAVEVEVLGRIASTTAELIVKYDGSIRNLIDQWVQVARWE